MSDRISHTSHGDAPLSTARDPNAQSIGIEAASDDELIGRTITINRPRAELYAFWRAFENLAHVMENIESVTEIDATRSHWVVRAPAGKTVEWDSVIVEDIPDELISWQSDAGAEIQHSGQDRVSRCAGRARHDRDCDDRLRPACRRRRQAHRQALSARAEDSGAPRPATLQATHGDRRDRHFAHERGCRRAARLTSDRPGHSKCEH